jgi:outer membrane protein OmpA-like peptidoglycan-associated protein
MSDTPTNGFPETARPPQSPNGDGWGELRSLLVGPERTQLEQLQARLDALRVYPEDVSQVLAEAIHLRSNQDKQLTNALLPSVEEALRASVQRNPRVLVDTLFPMMGPTIRKAITTALRSMLDSLNRSLAMSFSLRGLKWHWEAFRAGKPFAEIVLLHTLSYRVEQVFLIHKETGLLLQHVIAESVPGQDGEMISGMLTAIQDFMRDSFGGAEGESLDTVEYGDRTLWIEQGPQAILAGVVWGNAPRELKIVFQEALESIHFEMREALGSFQGDASPFTAIHHYLEACLQEQVKAEESRRSAGAVWLIIAAVLLALGAWGWSLMRAHQSRKQAQQRWTACLSTLRTQPGTVVLTVENHHGTYFLSGLLDPLAPEPFTLPEVARMCADIDVSRQWQTYYALHPTFVAERARRALDPPDTVALGLDDHGVLHVTGTAPYQWILEAQKLARVIPGITQLQTEQLVAVDRPEQILARARATLTPPSTVTLRLDNEVLYASGEAPHRWLVEARKRAPTIPGIKWWREEQMVDTTLKALTVFKDEVEKYSLRFVKGTVRPDSGQDMVLPKMSTAVRQLVDAASAVHYSVQIEVLGHTDKTGSVEENLRLAQGRAEYVIAGLRSQGLAEIKLTAVGAGWRQPLQGEMTEEDRALNRRTSLKVILTDALEEEG